MIIHLGEIEFPYEDKEGTTTIQVAQWLEDEYHIIEVFYERDPQRFADLLEEGLAGHLENLLMGAPTPDDIFAGAMSQIKKDFTVYITTGQVEQMGIKGVPTKAALMRRSLRFKSKKASKPRPSFVDTGLYVAAFLAWIGDEEEVEEEEE